jgi:hypothetical protein
MRVSTESTWSVRDRHERSSRAQVEGGQNSNGLHIGVIVDHFYEVCSFHPHES